MLTDAFNITLTKTLTLYKGKWCPDRWTRFGSSCYFKREMTATWDYGRIYCMQEGAHLVIINSHSEQVSPFISV